MTTCKGEDAGDRAGVSAAPQDSGDYVSAVSSTFCRGRIDAGVLVDTPSYCA
jgi:hypothetical protein